MATNQRESASLHSTIQMGSESVYDFFCGVCDLDGKFLEAIGYCEDCEDYLCQECYNTHLKPRPMRHHVLLDQHQMPKVTSKKPIPMGDHVLRDQDHMPKATSQRQSMDMCTEPCAEHKNETLKFYCADHKKFSCSVCMTFHLRNCEGMDYIPDIAGDVLTSREYKDMNLKLKDLLNTAQQTIKTTQQKTQTSNQQHSDASEFFKQLKIDLIAAVERIETSAMTDAGRIRNENQKKMKSVEDQCNQLLKDIGALDSKFTSLENKSQHCQIFFSMKKEKDAIAALEAHLLQLQDQDNNITEYKVQLNEAFQALIQQPEKMAALEITRNQQIAAQDILPLPPNTQQNKPSTLAEPLSTQGYSLAALRESEEHKKSTAVHVSDIDMRMKDDIEDLYITGSVVLPGDKLVIVDSNIATVKLINLQSNKIVSRLRCDGDLWDITAVTNTQVAVTNPDDNTILFINVTKSNRIFNVTNKLTLDHKVKVMGKCHGIASINDKLVITYRDPDKVEIISQNGKLLQTVVIEDRGRQLFTEPDYVAVSPDQQTVYISDGYRGDTVTSLDLSGQVKATYKDKELECPCGLIIDRDGVLYVCGYSSNNIHQLTPGLNKIQILLQKSDGIWSPTSVTYSEEQNKLYITMYNSSKVKVYQLQ